MRPGGVGLPLPGNSKNYPPETDSPSHEPRVSAIIFPEPNFHRILQRVSTFSTGLYNFPRVSTITHPYPEILKIPNRREIGQAAIHGFLQLSLRS